MEYLTANKNDIKSFHDMKNIYDIMPNEMQNVKLHVYCYLL